MSKKKTLTAVFVILICILIGGVLLRQYKRANTTECILKGTITSIEDNVFTAMPDTSNLNAMGPTYLACGFPIVPPRTAKPRYTAGMA